MSISSDVINCFLSYINNKKTLLNATSLNKKYYENRFANNIINKIRIIVKNLQKMPNSKRYTNIVLYVHMKYYTSENIYVLIKHFEYVKKLSLYIINSSLSTDINLSMFDRIENVRITEIMMNEYMHDLSQKTFQLSLPKNTKTFEGFFTSYIPDFVNLPNTLKKISISCHTDTHMYLSNIPDSVLHLSVVNVNVDIFPKNTKRLKICGSEMQHNMHYMNNLQLLCQLSQQNHSEQWKLNTELLPTCMEILLNVHFTNVVDLGSFNNLTVLVLAQNFNNDITNYPPNLKILKYGSSYKKQIQNLPDSITELYIPASYNKKIDRYPNDLEILHFFNNSHHEQNDECDFTIDNLPNKLIEIKYPYSYNHPINNLPDTVKYLTFDDNSYYNKNITLSKDMEYVRFGNNFNSAITLNNKLQYLLFNKKSLYNIRIKDIDNIKYAIMGDLYNYMYGHRNICKIYNIEYKGHMINKKMHDIMEKYFICLKQSDFI